MDRNSVAWRGYLPALTIPFTASGELDEDGLAGLYRWVLGEGVHGVITLGTQGEWFNLDDDERQRVLAITAAELGGRIPIIAGCSAFRAGDVLANIDRAAALGFDGALVTPPPYMVPTDAEIEAFYGEVSRHSALPLCVYNWPPGTNVNMSTALLTRLADLERVVAIKNSTPDLRHFMDVLFSLRDRVRIFGVPMNELGASLVAHHGADGTMGAGAVLGRDQPAFFEAIWEGDMERAITLGRRDETLMRAWFRPDYTGRFGSAQAIFKAALNLQGLPGGYPRPPLLPLDEDGVARVRETLVSLGRLPA
jgi:4-hydroxy-tetrahydrodipicolinate synthase